MTIRGVVYLVTPWLPWSALVCTYELPPIPPVVSSC